MVSKSILFASAILICSAKTLDSNAQIASNAYTYHGNSPENGIIRVLVYNHYMTLTEFQTKPAKFLKSVGGFYTVIGDTLRVQLEFNSNYAKDSLKILHIPFANSTGNLILDLGGEKEFVASTKIIQDLDGAWLMAGRVVDSIEQRRDTQTPRKTLKILWQGFFQWIAFHTETMAFSGSGGGTFVAKDGMYTEKIDFFSRDSSRVGTVLPFTYNIEGTDWHHMGKSSKGAPLHEIWAQRQP